MSSTTVLKNMESCEVIAIELATQIMEHSATEQNEIVKKIYQTVISHRQNKIHELEEEVTWLKDTLANLMSSPATPINKSAD